METPRHLVDLKNKAFWLLLNLESFEYKITLNEMQTFNFLQKQMWLVELDILSHAMLSYD